MVKPVFNGQLDIQTRVNPHIADVPVLNEQANETKSSASIDKLITLHDLVNHRVEENREQCMEIIKLGEVMPAVY